MSSLQRRFEILLPQRFNDGQAVPDELFADTLLELRQQFHAVSSETQIIRGAWEHGGQAFRERLDSRVRRCGRYAREPGFLSGAEGAAERTIPADRNSDHKLHH